MNENKPMTAYQRNEQAAKEQFQTEMVKYGLKIDRSSTGGTYCDNCMEFFNLHMVTEKLPVKGNKKLIERLEARGYYVQKCMGISKPRHFKFWVSKVYLISTTQVAEPVAR